MDHTETNQAEQDFLATFAAKPDTPARPEPRAVAAAEDDPSLETESEGTAADADDTQNTQDPDADEAQDDPSDEPESDAPAAKDTTDEQDGDEDEDDETPDTANEPADPALSGEFADAMQRVGVDLADVTDLPPSGQRAVLTKFKQLETGFTRLRQKDTEDLVTLRSEQRFQRDHAADFIVAQIRKNPKLADDVNAMLDEFEQSPTAARAHDVVVERGREQARTAEQSAQADLDAKAEQRQRELVALDAHLVSRVTAAGFKPEDKHPALVRMVNLATAAAKAEQRIITREEINAIVADYAADVKGKTERERKLGRRQERARVVRDTVATRRDASPVRPGAGAPPAAGKPPTARNDDEFVAQFAGS